MNEDIHREVRHLIDRQAIWDVMVRYSRGIDRLDRELINSVYHQDATDDHHWVTGPADGFVDWAFELHSSQQISTHHCLTNHSCEIDGDDAHAETYFMFVGTNLAPPHLFTVGRYIDHLQRRDGVWKIADRTCLLESIFNLTEDQMVKAWPLDRTAPLPSVGRNRDDISYVRPSGWNPGKID